MGRALRSRAERDRRSAVRSPRAATACRCSKARLIEPFRVRRRQARWRIDAATPTGCSATLHPAARLAYRDVASATNRRHADCRDPAGAHACPRTRCSASGTRFRSASACAVCAVQQPRREFPGAHARHDARDDGHRRAAADSARGPARTGGRGARLSCGCASPAVTTRRSSSGSTRSWRSCISYRPTNSRTCSARFRSSTQPNAPRCSTTSGGCEP